MNRDRREIAPLLAPHFPFMADASSEDWQAFLNEKTGLQISNELNPTAFDRWRKALAEQHGLPVWGYTADTLADIQARGEAMMAKEAKWRSENLTKAAEMDALIAKMNP